MRLFRIIFRIVIALLLLSVGVVAMYRYVPVPITPLMVRNALSSAIKGEATTFHHDWVPMGQMSPHLACAVVASEDQRFYQHSGFDWKEIGNAIEERKVGKRKRGGSTISQQTAKNVFTFCSSTWARKAVEAAAAPKKAVVCPYCGATTTPDEKGCCEYCGAPVGQ